MRQLLAAIHGVGNKVEHKAERLESNYNRRMDKMEANITDMLKAEAAK